MLTFAIMLLVLFMFLLFFYVAIDGKFDWTEEKKLLLWYTDEEAGRKVRKFITLFKL